MVFASEKVGSVASNRGRTLRSKPMFVAALPATSNRDECAVSEYVEPRAYVAQGLSSAGGTGGSSKSLHTHQYRGVTP